MDYHFRMEEVFLTNDRAIKRLQAKLFGKLDAPSQYHPDWKLGLSKITLTICSIRTLTCWLSKDVTELCHDSDCYLGSICPLGLKFD